MKKPIKKKVIRKEVKVYDVEEEAIQTVTHDIMAEFKIIETSTDFGREDLNSLAAKVNEIIRKINQ